MSMDSIVVKIARERGLLEDAQGDAILRDLQPGGSAAQHLLRLGIASGQTMSEILMEARWRSPETPFAGRYRIEQRIGQGGAGTVFRVLDTTLDRKVALKLVRTRAESPRAARRFLREIRAFGALRHPHIVRVFDAGEVPEGTFLTMELVEGPNLAERLHERRDSRAELIALLGQASRAHDQLHAAGIIHRDVKSSNILTSAATGAKLADFGLVLSEDSGDPRLTQPGTLLGTPLYLAPEVAEGGSATRASDVYALGVVLYEILCGRHPYVGRNSMEVISRILEGGPDRPSALDPETPGHLEDLCLAALATAPEARPSSAAEFADLLAEPRPASPRSVVDPVVARGRAAPGTDRRRARRSLRWPGAIGASLAAGAAVLIFLHLAPDDPSPDGVAGAEGTRPLRGDSTPARDGEGRYREAEAFESTWRDVPESRAAVHARYEAICRSDPGTAVAERAGTRIAALLEIWIDQVERDARGRARAGQPDGALDLLLAAQAQLEDRHWRERIGALAESLVPAVDPQAETAGPDELLREILMAERVLGAPGGRLLSAASRERVELERDRLRTRFEAGCDALAGESRRLAEQADGTDPADLPATSSGLQELLSRKPSWLGVRDDLPQRDEIEALERSVAQRLRDAQRALAASLLEDLRLGRVDEATARAASTATWSDFGAADVVRVGEFLLATRRAAWRRIAEAADVAGARACWTGAAGDLRLGEVPYPLDLERSIFDGAESAARRAMDALADLAAGRGPEGGIFLRTREEPAPVRRLVTAVHPVDDDPLSGSFTVRSTEGSPSTLRLRDLEAADLAMLAFGLPIGRVGDARGLVGLYLSIGDAEAARAALQEHDLGNDEAWLAAHVSALTSSVAAGEGERGKPEPERPRLPDRDEIVAWRGRGSRALEAGQRTTYTTADPVGQAIRRTSSSILDFERAAFRGDEAAIVKTWAEYTRVVADHEGLLGIVPPGGDHQD